MISPDLQKLINKESEREAYVRELESKVNTLTAALTGNQPMQNDDLFAVLSPDDVARYITIAQLRDGYKRGLLLNITEAALAAGKSTANFSLSYRNPTSNLPSLTLLGTENQEGRGRSNRTTLFYIGWIAAKWAAGPGSLAWRKGRAAYDAWVRDNLDR